MEVELGLASYNSYVVAYEVDAYRFDEKDV